MTFCLNEKDWNYLSIQRYQSQSRVYATLSPLLWFLYFEAKLSERKFLHLHREMRLRALNRN